MENRFRFSRAKTRFECFDCFEQITIQAQFCYDNMRNVRICEPCFMRLSKIVAPASPVKQEQGANTSTKQEDCQQCQQEAKRKRLKMSDTVEGWLACLLKAETTEGAIAVWKDCDNIAWDRDERKQLGFKYVSHLAQLESLKRWGSKTKVQVFEKAILALPDYVPPPF